MRRALLLLLAYAALPGCMTAPGSAPSTSTSPRADREAASEYEGEAVPAAASALVFRPPLAPDDLDAALARAGRDPSAFVGYDELITEYYYVRTDDRQASGFGPFGFNGDRHERRAVSEKVGVRYR